METGRKQMVATQGPIVGGDNIKDIGAGDLPKQIGPDYGSVDGDVRVDAHDVGGGDEVLINYD